MTDGYQSTSGFRQGILDLLEKVVRDTAPWPRELCAKLATNCMLRTLESCRRTTLRDIPRGMVTRRHIDTLVIAWLLWPHHHQNFTRIQ